MRFYADLLFGQTPEEHSVVLEAPSMIDAVSQLQAFKAGFELGTGLAVKVEVSGISILKVRGRVYKPFREVSLAPTPAGSPT